MSKYYKAQDVDYAMRMKYAEEDNEEREKVISEICRLISDLPTIEVSEDCISRADLMKELRKDAERVEIEEFACDTVWRTISNAPSVVPSTEQSSRVGEWQITDAYPHNVYCSECHKKFAQTHWAVWEDGSLPRNYCPNCGAKMKG